MLYHCARCHEHFQVDGEAERCPKCNAEAGLEPKPASVPFAMRLFGATLALAALTALVGTIWAYTEGSGNVHHAHWSNNGVP